MKGIVKRILNKLFPSSETKELLRLRKIKRYEAGSSNFFGFPMYFADANTYIHGGEEIFQKKIYEFRSNIENPLIIDCGANIGLSAIYFKKLYPKARVKAFEPDKQLFEILKKNVEQLQLNDVELYQKAIWIEDGTISFQEEGGFSGRIPKKGDEINIVTVPSFRLKNLLHDGVDFLKIDIEGAEYAVLIDCAEYLPKVDKIFIEYHSHIDEPQKLDEILLLLNKSGFRYHIQEAYSRKMPYVDNSLMVGMDLQLNIFGYRN